MSQPCRKLKRICISAIALLVAIFLTPGDHGQVHAASGAAQAETLSICVGGATGIPVILDHAQGLFARAGLEVNQKKYFVGRRGLAGMLAGECDMATVGETPVVMKSFERQDFSILATLATSDDSTRILANKERGILRPEELKGKRIFVHKGTTNHFFVEMFLAENNLAAKDVTLIHTDVEDFPEALTTGSIDAFAGTDVLISKSREALGDKGVVFSSPGLCLITFNLVAMNSFVRDRPQVVKSVVSALLQGEDILIKNRPQAIKILAGAMHGSEDDMAATLDSYSWKVGLAQTLFLSLEQEAQWAVDSGLTTANRIPNYLDFIHRDALFLLRPEAVTMLK